MKYKPRTKAAMYVRLAAASDAGIVKQMNTVLKMVDLKDESLINIYVDNGTSGLTLERPEFQRLLGDAKGGAFAKLYIRDMSRISRDQNQLKAACEQLHIYGVEIVSRDNPDDPKLVIA